MNAAPSTVFPRLIPAAPPHAPDPFAADPAATKPFAANPFAAVAAPSPGPAPAAFSHAAPSPAAPSPAFPAPVFPAPAGLREAWVCFGDGRGVWWLRGLKPGFRHCFVVLGDEKRWVVIDPASCFTDVAALDRAERPDLPDWFRTQGFTVARAPLLRNAARAAPWRPFTCVEAVKRILGLRAPAALTPWGLYRSISRNIFV